jgi:hypothetical protein
MSQERVGDLGLLAAYMALDLKTAAQPKVSQAQTCSESLNKWHSTLPPPLQLRRLSLADPLPSDWHTRRSLFLLHILFLGIFIESHKNCLITLGDFRSGSAPLESGDLESLQYIEEQCVLAARQSARVASLLQADNLIRSHCWISM